MGRKIWSKEDEWELYKMYSEDGRDVKYIAKYFDVTISSIHSKVHSCYMLRPPKVQDNHMTCSKCQCELPLSDEYFHRDRHSSTGFKTICKDCESKRKNRSRTFSHFTEEQRKYIINNYSKKCVSIKDMAKYLNCKPSRLYEFASDCRKKGIDIGNRK